MLALVELDDEPGVGNPVVAARQHVAPDEGVDAVPAMSLQSCGHVPEHGRDGGSRVGLEACPPSESMVRHALSVDPLEKLAHPGLACGTPLVMALRGSHTRLPHGWGRYGSLAAVPDGAPALTLDDGEAPAAKELVGLRPSGEAIRVQ